MPPVSPLAPALIGTIRRLRLARLLLRRNRLRYLAQQDVLDQAIAVIHDRDEEIARLRAQQAHLREELRRYLSEAVMGMAP